MKALNYNAKSAKAAVNVGQYLKETMDKKGSQSNETVMVEHSYWDFIYVELAARYFDRVIFDRVESNELTGIPSVLLSMEDEDILPYMSKNKTNLIAVKDEGIKKRLNSLNFIHKLKELDGWIIYRVDLNYNNHDFH